MFTQLTIGLALVAVCYGRSNGEIKEWFFGLAVECNKEYSITPEEMVMLQHHRIPDSDTAKCLMECIYRKADMMDDKGNYDLEKTNKWVATEFEDDATRLETAKNLFGMCKKACTVNEEEVSDGEQGCERAYHLTKCLTENMPKVEIQ